VGSCGLSPAVEMRIAVWGEGNVRCETSVGMAVTGVVRSVEIWSRRIVSWYHRCIVYDRCESGGLFSALWLLHVRYLIMVDI
jgi:hypothetical protein